MIVISQVQVFFAVNKPVITSKASLGVFIPFFILTGFLGTESCEMRLVSL